MVEDAVVVGGSAGSEADDEGAFVVDGDEVGRRGRYTTLADLRIDLSGAKFDKFEKFEDQPTSTQAPTTAVAGLTIRQAKAGLARTYEVDVDAIEIVIRG